MKVRSLPENTLKWGGSFLLNYLNRKKWGSQFGFHLFLAIVVILPMAVQGNGIKSLVDITPMDQPPITVTGTVYDDAGQPLIGVNIQVKGTNQGTSTDFDGNFVLENVDEQAVLVVSYVGYQTQEVP